MLHEHTLWYMVHGTSRINSARCACIYNAHAPIVIKLDCFLQPESENYSSWLVHKHYAETVMLQYNSLINNFFAKRVA